MEGVILPPRDNMWKMPYKMYPCITGTGSATLSRPPGLAIMQRWLMTQTDLQLF